MTPAILTIAYIIAICALVWLGHRHELAVHNADQRERERQRKAEGFRGGEVDFIQHGEGTNDA